MTRPESVLLVENDRACAFALATLLRRHGTAVRVAHSRTVALAAAQQRVFDLAVVDLFVKGGGADLARALSRFVPRVWLTLGTRAATEDVLEAVLGFPVHPKGLLARLLAEPERRARDGSAGKPLEFDS